MLRAALLFTLGLTLAACAPATRAGARQPLFMPGGPDLARICGQAGRVARDGSLLWNDSSRQHSQPAPYLLACNDYTLQNDGVTVQVQDDTLARALTHFDPGAHFLQYADALAVRFPARGLISADPAGASATLATVKILVRQPGGAETPVLSGGQLTPVQYDPSLPLTVRLQTPDRTFVWSEVTVQADKGLITAPVPAR